MTNKVVIHVQVDDKGVGPGLAGIKRGVDSAFKDVAASAEKSGKDAGEKLGGGISKGVGKASDGIIRDIDTVNKNIVIGAEKAGHEAGEKLGDGISDGIGKAGGSSGKLRDSLAKSGTEAGIGMGSAIGRGAAGSLTRNPALIAAAAGVGALMAPLIGGVIAGGIIGTAGGLGIVGGFMVAKNDPRVKGAISQLKEDIGDDLEDAVKPFVPAVLGAIDKGRAAFKGMLPDIKSIFAESGDLLDPLLDGVLRGAGNLVGGIKDAVAEAEPVFQAFGKLADLTLTAVGDVFSDLADDAPEAAQAIEDLGGVIAGSIQGIGAMIEGLVNIHGALSDFRNEAEKFTGMDFTPDGLTELEVAGEGAAEGIGSLIDALDIEADAHNLAAEAANGQVEALKGLADQLRAEVDPVFALLKAETDLGKARTELGKKTKKYGADSAEAKAELNKMAKASIDLQSAIGELGGEFNGKLSPSLRRTLTSAGLTSKEINRLEKEFIEAKKRGDGFAKTYRANLTVGGVKTALNQLYSVQDVIRDIPRAVNIAMRITGTRNVSAAAAAVRKNFATGGIKGAASGMVAGDLTWVGEQGPELVSLPTGSTVHSKATSARMMQQMQGQANGGPVQVILQPAPGSEHHLTNALLRSLRLAVNAQGGSVQTVLGRSY